MPIRDTMIRMRRVVRRSLAVSLLAVLVATVLAAVTGPASSSPGEGHGAGEAPAARIEAPSGQLTVGHADVLRLYWAFFNRDPDPAGAQYWMERFDSGATIDQIAFSFAVSDEFQFRYGMTGNDEFVAIVYRNVLGRSPDPDGFRYWTGLLDGTSATRINVVRWISASTEFIGRHPYRAESVQRAVDADRHTGAAVDVIESIVAGRPTAHLPGQRSEALESAISELRSRFGPHSSVRPVDICVDVAGGSRCDVEVSEAGLGRMLSVTVDAGMVVGIDGVAGTGIDDWAVDAVRTAATGREVYGSHRLAAGDRRTVSREAGRIAGAIGTVGRARIEPVLQCSETIVPGPFPAEPPLHRRSCVASVTGPTMAIQVEAVAHDGRFAGINTLIPRQYSEQEYAPYATIGPVTLHLPAARVERIGYHESGHDGARQHEPVDGSVLTMTMASRGRDTLSRGAADIAVDPDVEIRSPVTGTVLRAGSYVLYCRYDDHYLVIEPDSRPGYEVKLLHFEGLSVAKGDRVVAGATVVGSNARILPFASQIDAFTADPSNPHIHIEVVDPSIPDRPSGGGC